MIVFGYQLSYFVAPRFFKFIERIEMPYSETYISQIYGIAKFTTKNIWRYYFHYEIDGIS